MNTGGNQVPERMADLAQSRAALLRAHVRLLGARVQVARCTFRLGEAEGRIDAGERLKFGLKIKRIMRLSNAAKRLTAIQAACRAAEAYLREARAPGSGGRSTA